MASRETEMDALSNEKYYISRVLFNVSWKGKKNRQTITWAALGGIHEVPKEELSRVASQIYLRKRAGRTHVAFREKWKSTTETVSMTGNDLPAHT